MFERQYSPLDRVIMDFDQLIGGVSTGKQTVLRQNPGETSSPGRLTEQSRQVSSGLMRVNHAGEVSAQALYHAQALTARSPGVKKAMQQAAEEEIDHLEWCDQRLKELNSRPSYLNPLWYAGSFGIGLVAGLLGDHWSLGFVAETERQVVAHLESHLEYLPKTDARSRAILEQMKEDEAEHASMATHSGAAELPLSVRKIMTLCSRIMTTTAYWI